MLGSIIVQIDLAAFSQAQVIRGTALNRSGCSSVGSLALEPEIPPNGTDARRKLIKNTRTGPAPIAEESVALKNAIQVRQVRHRPIVGVGEWQNPGGSEADQNHVQRGHD